MITSFLVFGLTAAVASSDPTTFVPRSLVAKTPPPFSSPLFRSPTAIENAEAMRSRVKSPDDPSVVSGIRMRVGDPNLDPKIERKQKNLDPKIERKPEDRRK
jgi:hypothetical protein